MSATVNIPSSSAIVSSIPSAPPGRFCNTGIWVDVPEGNVTRPFCSFRWPDFLPDVASCCNDGAELQMADSEADNCTQYCERSDGDAGKWRECLQRVEPDLEAAWGSMVCHLPPDEDDVTAVSGTSSSTGIATESDMTSATTTGDAAQTSATGSGNDDEDNDDVVEIEEGSATLGRPMTAMGWFVSLLAIGAGLMA